MLVNSLSPLTQGRPFTTERHEVIPYFHDIITFGDVKHGPDEIEYDGYVH